MNIDQTYTVKGEFKKKMINITAFTILGCAMIVSFIIWRQGIHNLIIKNYSVKTDSIKWEDKGPTPLGEKKFTPQGMTWVNGKIIFANTWKNTNSRVYEIDPVSMNILRHFDMPDGAVHTSGLAWDGKNLWAVDYISNTAYYINLEVSLQNASVELIGSFDTTLKGTSACCIVPWKGRDYLAISDFRRTRKTIFVRMDDALKSKSADGNIDFYYINECFSQGLEFIDGYLYESENKLGRNIINKMDLDLLVKTRDARKSTVIQFMAPSKGVEDLAWSGDALWTSDETVFKFFKGTFK